MGRLFGAEALLNSAIFLKQGEESGLEKLLDLICALAKKKPWLRQECGWMLYRCIVKPPSTLSPVIAETILNSLLQYKLIRTPEGIAIWLAIKNRFPDLHFLKELWKHNDPLNKKDKILLAKAIKDTQPVRDDEKDRERAHANSVWNAQLHFVWDVVLNEFYSTISELHQPKKVNRLSFESFWAEVVDGRLIPT